MTGQLQHLRGAARRGQDAAKVDVSQPPRKWMCHSPKGSAFIHAAPNATNREGTRQHDRLQLTTTCTSYREDPTFAGCFQYVGTRD